MRKNEYVYTVKLDDGEERKFNNLSKAKDFYFVKAYTNFSYEWPKGKFFHDYFDGKDVPQIYLNHLKHFSREPVPYINCTVCGEKIFKGENVYHILGYAYRCCSAKCLLDSITAYNVSKLQGSLLDDANLK